MPGVAPVAVAVIVAVLLPSGKLSFTAVMSKLTEAWPSGIVTEAGTVASVVSLEDSVTSSDPVVEPERVTEPTEAGFEALSEKVEGVAPIVSKTDPPPLATKPLTPGDPTSEAFSADAKAPVFPATAAR